MTISNSIFADLAAPPHGPRAERVTPLRDAAGVRIERIVSHGHASAAGFWYDQEQSEWVIVLRGAARLLFAGDERPITLAPGDYLDIPAHKKHRVEWTTPDEPTVWLAVHYDSER